MIPKTESISFYAWKEDSRFYYLDNFSNACLLQTDCFDIFT